MARAPLARVQNLKCVYSTETEHSSPHLYRPDRPCYNDPRLRDSSARKLSGFPNITDEIN